MSAINGIGLVLCIAGGVGYHSMKRAGSETSPKYDPVRQAEAELDEFISVDGDLSDGWDDTSGEGHTGGSPRGTERL